MRFDLIIHIGDVSGAYLNIKPEQVWRVSQDGKICDTYRTLRYVFEMDEKSFFERIIAVNSTGNFTANYNKWKSEYDLLYHGIGELPYSNLWVAKTLAPRLPKNAILHLGILNTLRSWNFFEISSDIRTYSNTGGFGIDGCLSSVLGAALAEKDKVFYVALGDLAFFYDMNALGNRHMPNNIRILVINNGHGQEFTNFGHRAEQFGEKTEVYIAAAGHYGNKSNVLIKNYVVALGFKYLAAGDKNEFLDIVEEFISCEDMKTPILLEVFTNSDEETEALKRVLSLYNNESRVKQTVKRIVGEKNIELIKQIVKG